MGTDVKEVQLDLQSVLAVVFDSLPDVACVQCRILCIFTYNGVDMAFVFKRFLRNEKWRSGYASCME